LSGAAGPARSWLPEFVLLGALWGASFLFTRISVAEFGAIPMAFVRVLIGALFLLPVLLWRGQGTALCQHWGKTMAIGTINSGLPFACFAYALLTISTGLSAILNATAPLFGALVAWCWLKDRLSPLQALGLLIGFGGVVLLAWDEARVDPQGALWAIAACLLATLCYGLSANFTKRWFGAVPPLTTACGSQIGAALGLLLPALWLWPARTPSLQAWSAALAAGVFCTGIAYILYFRLIASAGPARAMAVTYLLPVFAILYGSLLLDEAVTLWMLLCGAVIVFGTALSTGALGRSLKPSR
jgi:drug/metabolite transporter (DMT)-like permease